MRKRGFGPVGLPECPESVDYRLYFTILGSHITFSLVYLSFFSFSFSFSFVKVRNYLFILNNANLIQKFQKHLHPLVNDGMANFGTENWPAFSIH